MSGGGQRSGAVFASVPRASVPLGIVRTLVFALMLHVAGCDRDGAEPGGASPSRAAAPNLVLITLDTTRADALGAYGQALPTSPNLDRLAKRGVLFEQVFSSNPETLPSHSTLFTGELPYVHGVRANSGYLLSESNVTLAEVLKEHGYATGAEVAAPVLRRETQVTQGFDHYRGAESPGVELKTIRFSRGKVREATKLMRVGADITARGIDFLREHRDEPFFLWLHYYDAHNPYAAPARFNALIPSSRYHAEVASADFQIGLLLIELAQLGLQDRTLVVVTADHGEGLDEHGEPSHGFFAYETTLHVPLIFAGLPQLHQGARVSSLVRTADVAPTILDLLGMPPLADAQGVSLVPLLLGAKSDLELTGYGEATRFTASFGMPPIRTVREGRWKYIHKVNPELFDVVADPHELTNLADRHPERVKQMRERLEAMIAEAPKHGDDARAAVDAQTAAQLMALGYVAKSPAFAIHDDPASLALSGDDPNAKMEDVEIITAGDGLLDRGEYASALELLEPLYTRNPESTYAMDLLSQAYLGLERYDEGIELLRRILERDPQNEQASYDLASALRAAGRTDEALLQLEGLLERNACDERVYVDLNGVLRDLGRHADLVRALATGAEACPDALPVLNNYAWALATLPEPELRDGDRAVELIRSVIARANGADPEPAYLDTLGAALAETGEFEEAIRVVSGEAEKLEGSALSEPVLRVLRAHLDRYRAGEPVREPPLEKQDASGHPTPPDAEGSARS